MGSRFDTVEDLKVGAKFVIGAEAANIINVAVQFIDRMNGNEMAERVGVAWYLADNAGGDTPSTVAPSAGIAIGTDGALIEWTANLSGWAISEIDGDLDVNITEVAAKSYYLMLVMPDGDVVSSGAITFA